MDVTPEGVPYATTSDAMSVADITAAMATGISAELAKLAAAGIVDSATARDELYPTPIQGNTVFRSDLGVRQTYFEAWNATTNPGGQGVSAGWVDQPRVFVQSAEPGSANGITPKAGDLWFW
jgi:hypothetical protein